MTWQAGDLAVCVNVADYVTPLGQLAIAGRRLRLSAVYRVAAVSFHPQGGWPVLAVEGDAATAAARRFRKIHPDKHEQCEPEFVTLLKRSKVKESASEWLERVGPLAKQLNEEARKEGDKR